MRTTSRALTAAGLLLLGAAFPARAVDQAKVEAAIQKGAEYLKKSGTNVTGQQPGEYGIGQLALVGLALLEAKVPPADPALVAIAEQVRTVAYGEGRTYQVSLGIVFLDRYGDPADRPLIQVLGARLAAGQNAAGGWTYTTFPEVPPAEAARLATALRSGGGKSKPTGPKDKDDDGFNVAKPKAAETGLHPEAARILQAARAAGAGLAVGMDGDNSNTQFAIIGLWVARRRGLPCDDHIRRIEARFVRTQSPADHGWAYTSGGGIGGSSPSMTCAGLIGLAVGKAVADVKVVKKKAEEDDPFFAPPKGEDGEDGKPKPKAPATARDAAIERGLAAVGRLLIGQNQGGVNPRGVGGGEMGGANDLYFFWSLERVAVAYGLDSVGGVNWYSWGCDRILPGQQADGSWQGSYNPPIATAFAVLFLCRSNFVTDLTKQITGKVKDPGEAVLQGRKGPLALSDRGRPKDAPKGGPVLPSGPELADPQAAGRVEALATALVNAGEADWKKRLDAARDRKGAEYTLCLLAAMPHLDTPRQAQARDALAERLVRMTPETLTKMIEDRDPELRRAAVLAAAMRDDRQFAPAIIDRVTDIDDGVTRAARAALKALSDGQDFGPPTGASDDVKRKAADDWRFWYARERGK